MLPRIAKVVLRSSGREVASLVSEGKVYPVERTFQSLLRASSVELKELLAKQSSESNDVVLSEKDVTFLPPIVDSHFTVYCVGKNYLDHVNEIKATAIGSEAPDSPIVFGKSMTSLTGANDKIQMPPSTVTQEVDYEGELAFIVGKPGKNIKKEDAFDHVFGFTVVNDLSARDKQRKHKQWTLAKGLDGFCPIGPWVVTKEEVFGDVAGTKVELGIQTTVNGEVRQNGNSRDMIFDIPTLVEEISAGLTLQTGDVIATGTPSGVGAGFDPPRFLAKGDTVKVTIERIGTVSNVLE